MSEYLLINLFIIAVPLFLSFENKIKYYRKFPAYAVSVVVVGGVYIIWDVAATARGDWGFNSQYLIGINVFNLPLEEVLFFITVPYSCFFIYETIKLYIDEKNILFPDFIISIIVIISIMSALIFYNQDYTFTVFLFVGLFFLTAKLLMKEILHSRIFWIYVFVSYLPFLVVNYFLTSLPIVTYGPQAIFGFRVTTIPIEDFFYSFSMLSLYLVVYLFAKKRLNL